jgi:hypothetical protein
MVERRGEREERGERKKRGERGQGKGRRNEEGM